MHGPSSADEQRGCRSQCAGLAYGCPHACVVRFAVAAPPTCSCPVSRPRTLTDAMHFLYHWPTLPLTWLRVTEATPPSKAIRVFHYRLLYRLPRRASSLCVPVLFNSNFTMRVELAVTVLTVGVPTEPHDAGRTARMARLKTRMEHPDSSSASHETSPWSQP